MSISNFDFCVDGLHKRKWLCNLREGGQEKKQLNKFFFSDCHIACKFSHCPLSTLSGQSSAAVETVTCHLENESNDFVLLCKTNVRKYCII